jgi:O-antigen/teichoic acid export membrane protein
MKKRLTIFLRWSERYTKTDMVYLASGGFWVTLAQIVVSSGSFLMAIAFAHLVPKEAYGDYKYLLSIASLLGGFTLTGLGTAVIRSVVRGKEGTLQYAFWQNIKWSALFFLGALAASVYYFLAGNSMFGIALLFIGCLSPVWSSTNLYSAFLTAKKDFRRNSLYFDIIGNLFPFACLFATILFTQNSLAIVLVYFAANTLIGVLLYIRVMRIYRPNLDIDTEALNYGTHLSLMNILNTIASNIDQIIVFHYIGAVQLAVYNFATAIPDQIKGPLKGLDSLIFPKFASRSEAEIRAAMWSKFMWLFVAAIAIVAAYVLLVPYVFHIFFPQYNDAIFYSQIYGLSLLGMTFGPATTYLAAKKKIKEQYASNISLSVFQIAVMIAFTAAWGLLGMVIARVAVRIAGAVVNMLLYERASRQAVKNTTP